MSKVVSACHFTITNIQKYSHESAYCIFLLQSFLLPIWLLLHHCITMSEEELVVKSYERGTIISRTCTCTLMKTGVELFMHSYWKHENSHSDRAGVRTTPNFLLGGSATVCNTFDLHKQLEKVTGRTVALSNRKKTLHVAPIIRGGEFAQKVRWHNTSYGQSRLQTGRGIHIIRISDQHNNVEGKEGPVDCSP